MKPYSIEVIYSKYNIWVNTFIIYDNSPRYTFEYYEGEQLTLDTQ